MIRKRVFTVLFFALFSTSFSVFAQTEPEDIAMATDEYQDSFYESLKQRN